MLVGGDAELIVKSVMPNFHHVIPVVHCTPHATHTRENYIKKKSATAARQRKFGVEIVGKR